MMQLIYFLVALLATTAGAATGMGGGVIIKPLLDVMGHYSAKQIALLSSLTVLVMSLVSVGRHLRARTRIDTHIALPLALGSVAGGYLGNLLLATAATDLPNKQIKVVQNVVLGLLIVLVLLYMRLREHIPSPHVSGIVPAGVSGMLLGVISSFLGIGGGPINVAILIYLFAFSTRNAGVYSLITILFAQLSKLATVLLFDGLSRYDLSVLPAMLVGAVLGGFLGPRISLSLSDQRMDTLFGWVQITVLLICGFNIVSSLL